MRRAIRPTVLSLFTGAGGLDIGLEQAGFTLVGSVEQDPDCRETITRNRPKWRQLDNGDIHAHTPREILAAFQIKPRELTLVAGGPPCQPFSKAALWVNGEAAGMADERAKTLEAYMGVVEAALPEAMLLENVKGLSSVGRGKKAEEQALDVLRGRLEGINARHKTAYRPFVLHLDAADYGVPQHRERVFVFAARDGTELRTPTPTHGPRAPGRKPQAYRTAWDAIGDLDNVESPHILQPRGRWAALLPSVPEGKNYLWHTPRGEGEPLFGWRTKFWSFLLKLAKDQPSWTLQAQPGPATGPFHWRNRRLSLQEMARLQTFPDDWEIVGEYSSARRQLGNAVPAAIGELLGLEIRRLLHGAKARRSLRLVPEVRPGCPKPEPVQAVPVAYHCLRGNHPDHGGTAKGPGAMRRKARDAAVKADRLERRVARLEERGADARALNVARARAHQARADAEDLARQASTLPKAA
jgi:DNA (cytosine-5)-methyltransferase 1